GAFHEPEPLAIGPLPAFPQFTFLAVQVLRNYVSDHRATSAEVLLIHCGLGDDDCGAATERKAAQTGALASETFTNRAPPLLCHLHNHVGAQAAVRTDPKQWMEGRNPHVKLAVKTEFRFIRRLIRVCAQRIAVLLLLRLRQAVRIAEIEPGHRRQVEFFRRGPSNCALRKEARALREYPATLECLNQ